MHVSARGARSIERPCRWMRQAACSRATRPLWVARCDKWEIGCPYREGLNEWRPGGAAASPPARYGIPKTPRGAREAAVTHGGGEDAYGCAAVASSGRGREGRGKAKNSAAAQPERGQGSRCGRRARLPRKSLGAIGRCGTDLAWRRCARGSGAWILACGLA